ncbi:hypothetical protein LO772_31960 [Yinghuangia sp. ASG 101]|uniref:hypothetical protein n=1 Tax=Yinghuangia sp. ASG 101 TaxID=2896848 RepID=UPI001E60A2BE|nr:hypothetical protein [Yinghuangia sp. ASG 101]UGQ11359.1 hypothetical protein LO772_31960 [Yinghuangia sp. ASG 101]
MITDVSADGSGTERGAARPADATFGAAKAMAESPAAATADQRYRRDRRRDCSVEIGIWSSFV